MSTPAAKRRRMEATQTLSKPFRSPFKTPFKSPLAKATPDSTTSTAATTTNRRALPPTPSLPSSKLSEKETLNRTIRPKKSFTSPVSTAALNADPDIAPLLRKQRELEKQLRELKEELETAEQARKIERESKKKKPDGEIDGELVELIQKWTSASRLAAEEMFGNVRDRVNRMGGPRAWKEMQKRQTEYQNTWDQEENPNNDSGDDGAEGRDVEKRDIYAEYGIDPETENEKSQRPSGLGDTGELPGQEDEFTIAMMLRTLNVDLAIIGYDKEQQRWVD